MAHFFRLMLLTFDSRGVPHSIQALSGGVEFMLIFDDGDFSEDATFLASELFATQPVSRIIPFQGKET